MILDGSSTAGPRSDSLAGHPGRNRCGYAETRDCFACKSATPARNVDAPEVGGSVSAAPAQDAKEGVDDSSLSGTRR